MDKTDVALRQREIYKVTLAGSVVNIVLTLCKFAAGILGRSAAMVADAVHSLSDLATDVIVLVFVRISGKPEDKGHDYGHGKYETLPRCLSGWRCSWWASVSCGAEASGFTRSSGARRWTSRAGLRWWRRWSR